MTIEIERPELEALIEQRMSSGLFATVEDALIEALRTPREAKTEPVKETSLGQILRESPLWGSGLDVERAEDFPRPAGF